MPSISLKLKHHSDEVVDVDVIEIEVSFDENDPEKGNFSFSTKTGDEEAYCFTLTDNGLRQLIQFYEQVKK